MPSRTPIDLKNSTIYIQDGYANAGAVNNVAGYSAGATTMLVDGIDGIIPVGTRFSVVGDTAGLEHTVVSTIETSGDTTSITFTPAIGGTIADGAVITFLPHRIEVNVGEGNFTYTERVTREYRRNKGSLSTVRDGDEEPVEVAFDFEWINIVGDTNDPPTIEEALKKIGNAADWVSSSDDPCEPYAVDLLIIYSPVCEDVKKEHILLEDFRYAELAHDLSEGTVSATGSANVTQAAATRVA